MPFQSKSAVRACFAKKAAGTNGSWNCDQWAHETPNIRSLPEKKMQFGGATTWAEKEKAAAEPKKRLSRLTKGSFNGRQKPKDRRQGQGKS